MPLIPLAYILAPINIYWYNYRKLYTYKTVTLTLKEYTLHTLVAHDTKSYLYSSKLRTKQALVYFTLTFTQSFNCCNLYKLKCFKVVKFNFPTKLVPATIVQLPLSIIMLHNLLLTCHLV